MGCWSLLGSGGHASSGSPGRGLAAALPLPPASPSINFRSPGAIPGGAGLSISSNTDPAAAPQSTFVPASARDNSDGSALLNPLHRRQGHGPQEKPACPGGCRKQEVLGPSHPTIKAGPSRAESLPTRQHHQPQSSIRHGTKRGHTSDVRHGYGNAPLPRPYKVQMRG